MIGLDTNVLLRWLRRDAAASAQSDLATRAVEGAGDIHVNLVALVEAVWVLGHVYKVRRAALGRIVLTLLEHSRVSVERSDLVADVLPAYLSGNADLSDHLIGAINARAGCATTLTFDKAAARGDDFTLLT